MPSEPAQLPARVTLEPSPLPGPQEEAERAELLPLYLAEVPTNERTTAAAEALRMDSEQLEHAMWVERVCNHEHFPAGKSRQARREELKDHPSEDLESLVRHPVRSLTRPTRR